MHYVNLRDGLWNGKLLTLKTAPPCILTVKVGTDWFVNFLDFNNLAPVTNPKKIYSRLNVKFLYKV